MTKLVDLLWGVMFIGGGGGGGNRGGAGKSQVAIGFLKNSEPVRNGEISRGRSVRPSVKDVDD